MVLFWRTFSDFPEVFQKYLPNDHWVRLICQELLSHTDSVFINARTLLSTKGQIMYLNVP